MKRLLTSALVFLAGTGSARSAEPLLVPLPPVESVQVRLVRYDDSPASSRRTQGAIDAPAAISVEHQSSVEGVGELAAACCKPVWAHRHFVYGEFLYLRPRGVEVAYAVPLDGPIAPNTVPIQIGPTAVVAPDYSPGWRVGFGLALDDCTSIAAGWMRLEVDARDDVSIEPNDVLRSLVMHPSSETTATDVLVAAARLDVDMDVLDVEFRRVWFADDYSVINYSAGARYARLDQTFSSAFENLGTSLVDAAVQFEGAGLRVGLDAERFAYRRALKIYARSSASFVAGDFRTTYEQFDAVDNFTVFNSWRAGRLVSILDLELGIGWVSADHRWHLTAGYLVSGWFNVVRTDKWIDHVQSANYAELGGSHVSFDGLTSRVEFRY
jgi:hypothetical protein